MPSQSFLAHFASSSETAPKLEDMPSAEQNHHLFSCTFIEVTTPCLTQEKHLAVWRSILSVRYGYGGWNKGAASVAKLATALTCCDQVLRLGQGLPLWLLGRQGHDDGGLWQESPAGRR